MAPTDIRFGGGASGTLIHPLIAIAMVVLVVLIVWLPRKYVIVPLLFGIFFIPTGQVLVVAGAHFTMARILVLAGLFRWVASRRAGALLNRLNSIDLFFVLWAVSCAAIFSLQWMQSQALIKSLGDFLDAMGGYFVLRFLIRDQEDVRRAIKALALIAMIMACFMINEQLTGFNIFDLLGGMPPSAVRAGNVRSQGAFDVYITAGVYGATLIPLLLGLWVDTKSKVYSSLGMMGSAVMAVTCFASTALGTFAVGIFALCWWPLRKKMRLVRWELILALFALSLVMRGPIWSLINKVDLTGSSSSYHRYMLVDNSIRHFGEWWALGYKDYNDWGVDMWDLSNQYVEYAVTGGLLTLLLFVGIIYRAFALLGKARRAAKGDRKREWFLWCLGCALFAHVTAYFGISYFDQMQFAWYALLAIISAATARVSEPVWVPAFEVDEEPAALMQA